MSDEGTPATTPDTAAPAAMPAAEPATPAVPAQEDVPAVPAEKPAEATLLGDDAAAETAPATPDTPDTTTPAEAPKEGDAPKEGEAEPKKEEASQSDEPAPLPTYEAFTLPDGFQMDDAKLGEFTKELGEFQNLTKADQKAVQEFGQRLVDRHIALTQEHQQRLVEHFTTTWEKQKNDWKDAFEADPEIGGNRKDTTLKAAKEFIRTYGGDESQRKEISKLMNETGIGNHPALIRLLAKAGEQLAEGRPLPAQKPPAAPQSKVDKRYGKSSG